MYATFKELDAQMLHTKFQGNRPSGSVVGEYVRFLPYMGIAVILDS